MKLALITEFFPDSSRQFSGGVEARTYFIAKFLQTRHRVTIISRPKTHIAASALSIFPRLAFQLTAFFRAVNTPADAIEGSNFICYLPAFLAAKAKKVPAVAWYADVYGPVWFQNFSLPSAAAGYLLEKLSLKLPWDQVIAMSRQTQAKLTKAGVNPKKITVVYGGVEVAQLQKLPAKKFPRPTVITLARLVNYKRVEDLIRAIALLVPDFPQLQLLILGDGPQRDTLARLSQSLHLTQNVRFHGNTPHPKAMALLKRAHVFCLPSVVEGFGLVTAEAMAAGVPYVSSRIPPTVEVTGNGQGGILYPPKDHRALAGGIRSLLTDKHLYRKKQAEAARWVSRYDWQAIANQTEKVYKRTITSRSETK